MIVSVVLAAGEGTRMKSKIPKVAHKICNESLVGHVIDATNEAGCEKNIVVVGHGKEKVKSVLDGEEVIFVEQPIGEDAPYGTGYAVMQALDHIADEDVVIVLAGDAPLIKGDTIKSVMNYTYENGFSSVVLTAKFENPFGYGRIVRNEDKTVKKIVEHKDANEEELKIDEINSALYTFIGKDLKGALNKIDNNNSQNEYYLTDVIGILNEEGKKVGAYVLEDNQEIKGINSRVQLAEVEAIMRKRINDKLMTDGVTIIDPASTYVSKKVRVGRDTILYPGVILEGETEIGEDCIIGQNTRIVDSKISNSVEIWSSTILESSVGENTKVGPYAYLRPKSEIGKDVKIGDFVEVKNAKIGDGSKASHLAYVGDAEIGSGVNIGCGVVFVNYDGVNKHKTVVGDNAFIGSNANLVAPVNVQDRGFVAAGSTITDDVEEGALAIARARQVNKAGWMNNKNNK